MQVKKKGQTCAEGLNINPIAQVCPIKENQLRYSHSLTNRIMRLHFIRLISPVFSSSIIASVKG